MPNHQNRGNEAFSRFDTMTDEELEEFLRLDAQNTQGEDTDTQTLLYVMEVLAERKRTSNPEKTAKQAFETFKQYYMPTEDLEIVSATASTRKSPRPRRWLRSLTAVAATVAIVFLCSMTASAFGYDIWETVAKWTQETFHFGNGVHTEVSEPDTDDSRDFNSLYDILNNSGVSVALAPIWFPNGYELIDVKVQESPLQQIFIAFYQNNVHEIKIQVKKYFDTDPQQIERSDGLVETYKSEGITYYIFSNNNLLQAVWVNDNYECYIAGVLTIDELKLMIDSIGKG